MDAETIAYTHMQARLIALLLRYDSTRFRTSITTHSGYDALTDDAPLHHYRELGVLFALRDDLFEHILPRIVRRLSFASPRATVIEEPPARGRVDWERTLDSTWDTYPDQPPLYLHTHQRYRDFATPENLLTVATLLDYRADVQHVLQHESLIMGTSVLRHPLTEIIERCERQLAFPQFAALRQHTQDMQDSETLEMHVRERLIPGGNSAYEELLVWREQRRTLRLLQRTRQTAEQSTVLGADPQRDNYLYQIWIFYELLELLHHKGILDEVDPSPGAMRLRFRWGTGPDCCRYELRHDQAIPDPVVRWQSTPYTRDIPGVRPDFALRRIDPPAHHVTHQGVCYWREPGIIWDAKYYRERESPRTPTTPLKRMLADVTLLGESYGVLLFAFLKDIPTPTTTSMPTVTGNGSEPADQTSTGESGAMGTRRVLTPLAGQDQTLVPDQQIVSMRLHPSGTQNAQQVAHVLDALLNDMHEHLRKPRVPRCQGIFLDSLSAAEQTETATRLGEQFDGSPDDLLVCPKPHIGLWRVDLVSRRQHCCQDARLCHIIALPDCTPPVRPPRTVEDLLKELHHIFARNTTPLEDEAVQVIAEQVERLTKRFAELAGAYRRIEVYYHRLRDMGLQRTLDLFDDASKESLALAVFLVEQLDSINANDYSAPALHISSVLEIENRRRVFSCPDLVGDGARPYKQTLGALPFLRRAYVERMENVPAARANWQRIVAYARLHWRGNVDPDDPEYEARFDNYAQQLYPISEIRNTAAHTEPLPRNKYTQLFEMTCQRGSRLRFGALNALMLAWS